MPQCGTCRSAKQSDKQKKTREARRAAQRVEAAARRAALLGYVNKLKNRACTDCKQFYPPYVMDFDHVSGIKHSNIAAMVRWGVRRSKIRAEIKKCELVCSNCHRKRTHSRALKKKHGDSSSTG